MQTSTISSTLSVAGHLQERMNPGQAVGRDRQNNVPDQAAKPVQQKGASEEILKKIQELTDGGNHSVRFEMDSEINVLVVKVYNSKTDELLRQIPAESLLGTARALQEFRRGLMVDDKT